MNGAMPPALLCLALGLALAFVPMRIAVGGAALLATVACGTWWIMPAATPPEPILISCLVSVIATAATTYLPRPLTIAPAVLFSLNAGGWAGASVAVAGTGVDLATAVPLVLVTALGAALVARGWGIAVKVAASWLIAIAALSAVLTLTPVPGYVPDHMD